MNLRFTLEKAARDCAVPLGTVEKDYLLTWILWGLSQNPQFSNRAVFKGGTALRKCYFGDSYRFSEDLDFTATQAALTGITLVKQIEIAMRLVEEKITEIGDFTLQWKRYLEKSDHPLGQEAFTIQARFPWQRQPLTTVMVEITLHESVLTPPIILPVLSSYPEIPPCQIPCYSLEEIAIEKLTAILATTKKLHEREWSRSRSRDVYDLWNLFRTYPRHFEPLDLISLLRKKCEPKGHFVSSHSDFWDPKWRSNVEASWTQWLAPLRSQLPPCQIVLEEFRTQLETHLRF